MGAERITNLLKKFQDYQDKKAIEFVAKAADAKRERMADLNREQLDEGQKSDHGRILEKYRPRTIKYKIIMGQQIDPPNLRDTGSWQDHIEAVKFHSRQYYEMQSADVKDEMLAENYGEEILGLTDEHVIVVSEEMLPDMINLTKKYFNL